MIARAGKLFRGSLGALAPRHQHQYAADDANAAYDGANRHPMFVLLVHFERSEFRDIFLSRELRKSSPGENNNSDDDQD